MKYAIEMYYDEATEKAILDLANKIADKGISTKYLEWKTRPHVTLACFSDVDEAKCRALLDEFAKNHSIKPENLDAVGMFSDTGTIFLAPTMNRELFDLQRDLHECMAAFDTTGWEWYRPDMWVPHCAVALTNEDPEAAFFEASDLVLHEFKKLYGQFVSVGLVKITFPVQELYTAALA